MIQVDNFFSMKPYNKCVLRHIEEAFNICIKNTKEVSINMSAKTRKR